jgi:hypothetical protein
MNQLPSIAAARRASSKWHPRRPNYEIRTSSRIVGSLRWDRKRAVGLSTGTLIVVPKFLHTRRLITILDVLGRELIQINHETLV